MPRQRFSRLPAEKQEKVFEAAGQEFATHGYDGASLNHLLQAAGISKGAAYYYFDDKADIYRAVLLHYWDRIMVSSILELDKLTAENFWDALAAVYRALLAHCIKRPWFLGLARSLWKLPPEMRSDGQLGQVYEMMRGWFGAALEKGRKFGVIRSDLPDDLVLALLMAVDEVKGTWLLEHWAEFDDPEKEALDFHLRTLDMIRRMLAPDAPPALCREDN
jgi:AcrR family transcriptional regulator